MIKNFTVLGFQKYSFETRRPRPICPVDITVQESHQPELFVESFFKWSDNSSSIFNTVLSEALGTANQNIILSTVRYMGMGAAWKAPRRGGGKC